MDKKQVELSTIRLLAKLPTIAAYAYKKSEGQPFLYPDNSLTLVENFLRMTFGFPGGAPLRSRPEIVRALDMLLILHADHEQNCLDVHGPAGGFPRRPICSPRSGWYQRPVGPAARWRQPGCAGDVEKIRQSGGDVQTFVKKVKNREDGVKPMRLRATGFTRTTTRGRAS